MRVIFSDVYNYLCFYVFLCDLVPPKRRDLNVIYLVCNKVQLYFMLAVLVQRAIQQNRSHIELITNK